MDLHFFFEGKLSGEEVASAFLATLLEQRPEIRQAFFDVLAKSIVAGRMGEPKQKDWKVSVEARSESGSEDIRLEATDGSALLVVENKLLAASKQKEQLLRYYTQHAKRDPKQQVAIGAVYLAPGSGRSEVEAVLKSDLFPKRPNDFVARVSWDRLTEAIEKFASEDLAGQFLTSGTEQIDIIIEEDGVKWPPVDGRQDVLDVVIAVRDSLLKQFPAIQLMRPWPGRERYTLSTRGTNVTVWLRAKFRAEHSEPYRPVDLWDAGRLRLTVGARIKLSATGRKQPGLRRRWEEVVRAKFLEVPKLGVLPVPEGGRWAEDEYPVTGTKAEVVARITEIGAALLQVVTTFR